MFACPNHVPSPEMERQLSTGLGLITQAKYDIMKSTHGVVVLAVVILHKLINGGLDGGGGPEFGIQ